MRLQPHLHSCAGQALPGATLGAALLAPVSCVILAGVHAHSMLQLVLALLANEGLSVISTAAPPILRSIGHQVVLHPAWIEAVCCDLSRHEECNAVGVGLRYKQGSRAAF